MQVEQHRVAISRRYIRRREYPHRDPRHMRLLHLDSMPLEQVCAQVALNARAHFSMQLDVLRRRVMGQILQNSLRLRADGLRRADIGKCYDGWASGFIHETFLTISSDRLDGPITVQHVA